MTRYAAFVLTLFLALAIPFVARSQTSPTASPPPQYSYGPITDYSAALPNSTDVLQFRRGERYNIPNPSLPELGEKSDERILELPTSHSQRDPMPFGGSDAVLIGTITAGQAHLSNDKRNVYSEFTVLIQEVIKTPTAPYLRVGDSIDIEGSGGAIRLPSGKVIVRGAATDSMPLVGGRYVLFLRYNPDTEDYHLQTGFQISGNHAYRLYDPQYIENHRDSKQYPLREEDSGADQVLSRIRSKAVVPPRGGQR